MPAPDKDAKIPCPTPQHLHAELETLSDILDLGEKEETWEKLERGLIRFAGITRGGGYKHPGYVEGIGRHGFGLKVVACAMSDRGRLSAVATDLIQVIAPRLGSSFAPLVSLYMDPLVRLFGRPNKVVLKRIDKCVDHIIRHCHLVSIVTELRKGLTDDSAMCRRACASSIQKAVELWDKSVWGEKGVVGLEDALRRIATDKDAEVRQTGKSLWALYTAQWPERVEEFTAPLTPTIRRRLDIPANGAGPAVKGKAPVRNMGPPAVPTRPISTASSASSAAVQPAKLGHNRVKSTTTHAAATSEVSGSSRSGPSNSAPASPQKAHKELKDVPLVRSHTGSTRLEGFGQPSRSASQNIIATSSRHVSPDKNDKHDLWSKPSRPHIPTSYSALSLRTDADDAFSTQAQPAARRFPPPSRPMRAHAPTQSAEDEHYFSGVASSSSTAGPSVLGGPVRLPPAAPPVPAPANRLGRPVQRRVVTAPIPASTSQPSRPVLPSAPSHSDIAQALVKGTRSVKKRVEQLEEEIKSNSQPGSPVLIPSPRPSTILYHSPSPLAVKKMKVADGMPGRAMESPLLPGLIKGKKGKQQDVEDLRTVKREEGDVEANMTLLESTEAPAEETKPTSSAEVGYFDQPIAGEQAQGQPMENERIGVDVSLPDKIADRAELPSDPSDVQLVQSQMADIQKENGDLEPSPDGADAVIEQIDDEAEGDRAVDAKDRAAPLVELDDKKGPSEIETMEEGVAADGHEMSEVAEALEKEQHESEQVIPVATDVMRESNIAEEGHADVTPTAEGLDRPSSPDKAVRIPLPCSPPRRTINVTEPELGAEPEEPPATAPPPAPYPKEPAALGSKPRLVSQPVVNGLKARAALTEGTTATRKPDVPRKAALPPPPVRARAAVAERKTFKPATAASRAAKPPVPTASSSAAKGKAVDIAAKTGAEIASGSAHTEEPPAVSVPANARNTKPPIPKIAKAGLGKSTTAPAIVARSVSASSSSTAAAHADVTAQPAKPKITSKPPIPKPVAVARSTKATTSTNPAPLVLTATGSSTSTLNKANKPVHASVTIPPVRTDRIKLKPALPSFKPVKGGSSAGAGLKKAPGPGLNASTGPSGRARVKPESVPLPLSPAEKAKMPPKDIPLPRSPVRERLEEEESEEKEVEEIEEKPEDRERLLGQEQRDEDEASDRPAEATRAIDIGTPRSAGQMGLLDPVSPQTQIRPSSLKSSPLSVSLPRALSPVLTTILPPPSPAHSESASVAPGTTRFDAESYVSPRVSVQDKLVDAPTPDDLPSPFLRRPVVDYPSTSSRYQSSRSHATSTTQAAEWNDQTTEEEIIVDDLGGLTTRLGQNPVRSAKKVPNQNSMIGGDEETMQEDLMELSASSRPAHGERKDVSTPVKAAEALLAKYASAKLDATTPGREILRVRDTNRSGSEEE